MKPYADILWDGAGALMKYNPAGATFDFTFKGCALDPDTEYSLIRSVHSGMPVALDVLAWGTPDERGTVRLAGSYDFDEDLDDARIMLVPSDIIGQGGNLFPAFLLRIREILMDHTICPEPTNPPGCPHVGIISHDDTDAP